jgi:hypothetical protein
MDTSLIGQTFCFAGSNSKSQIACAESIGNSFAGAMLYHPPFHRADLNRTDPRLDRALGTVTMPDNAVATVRQLEIFHGGEKRLGLHLDSLRKQLPSAVSEDIRQGIVDLVRLTKPNNTAILIHGVSLSLRGSGRLDTRLDTPPISHRHHPVSRLAP